MKQKSSWILVTVMAGVVASAAVAQEAGAQELPEGVTAEMVQKGGEIFAGDGLCVTCHGEKGAGTPLAPKLDDDQWLHIDGSYAAILKLVTEGVAQPKESMVPMMPKGGSQIDEEQVKAVAAYVWKLSQGS